MKFFSNIKQTFVLIFILLKKLFTNKLTSIQIMKDEKARLRADQLASSVELVVKNTLIAKSESSSGIGSFAFTHSPQSYVVEGFSWVEKLTGEIAVTTYNGFGMKTAEAIFPAPYSGNVCKSIEKKFMRNLATRGFSGFNVRFFPNN